VIVDLVRANIFHTNHKTIAFAVNIEGHNDSGFAGQVSSGYWRELADTGRKQLGDVLSREVGDKTFYALVCHSLGKDGWKKTPETLEKCLNSINVPEDETIAIVLIGSGMIGQLGGADTFAVLGAMARSKKRLVIYAR